MPRPAQHAHQKRQRSSSGWLARRIDAAVRAIAERLLTVETIERAELAELAQPARPAAA
jgi:hypothetical protein